MKIKDLLALLVKTFMFFVQAFILIFQGTLEYQLNL